MDPPLPLDLFSALKLSGKARLELTKPDVMEAGGVDVIASDLAARALTDLDGPVHGPVGMVGIVYRYEDFAIHENLEASALCAAPTRTGSIKAPVPVQLQGLQSHNRKGVQRVLCTAQLACPYAGDVWVSLRILDCRGGRTRAVRRPREAEPAAILTISPAVASNSRAFASFLRPYGDRSTERCIDLYRCPRSFQKYGASIPRFSSVSMTRTKGSTTPTIAD